MSLTKQFNLYISSTRKPMTPQPQLGTRSLAAASEYYATTPATCEPQSRLRMHEEKLRDRLAALQETALVLEGRLEPVIRYPEPQNTASCEKDTPKPSCELDAVFGRRSRPNRRDHPHPFANPRPPLPMNPDPIQPPPREPLRCAYSRAEMNHFVDAWMRLQFGELQSHPNADQWLRDSGLLRQFIQDYFPDNLGPNLNAPRFSAVCAEVLK